MENLDEILTVDNIDVFFMAPSDLAASMGVPWNPWSAEPEPRQVTETVDRCIRKIVDAGRTAGFLAREDAGERLRQRRQVLPDQLGPLGGQGRQVILGHGEPD